MKKKEILNEKIYLPDYFTGKLSNDLRKCQEFDILYWDFTKRIDIKVKTQIELLLKHIARTIKEKERRNKYLFLLKYLYCYIEEKKISDILKLELSQEQEYAELLKNHTRKVYSSPKKFIEFCREALFLKSKEIDWNANVWYVDKLDIQPDRFSQGNNIKSFTFLDVLMVENREALQRYTKYLLCISSLNLGTIRILHTQAKQLLEFLP